MVDKIKRLKRKKRIRKKIRGTALKPRVSVFRSISNIYVQVIDDDRGVTLTSACSLEKPLKEKKNEMDKKSIAKEVGKLIAIRCKAIGIKKVVFDRGGYKYHGRVAMVAEGAREGGLDF